MPLYALLLFSLPSELTFRALYEFPAFGERSHQFQHITKHTPCGVI